MVHFCFLLLILFGVLLKWLKIDLFLPETQDP